VKNQKRIAHFEPTWTARVIKRHPLRYSFRDESGQARPIHVRAGSGLCWLDEKLAILQDDASFIGLFEPGTGAVSALPLPFEVDGLRVFDDRHGNKDRKLDLEACVATLATDREPILIAIGSGSTPAREQIVVVRGDSRPQILAASALYESLRANVTFAGSELNIEGAAFLSAGALRLFQRGNGAPRGDLLPVNATGDLDWMALWSFLHREGRTKPPALCNIVQYDLGQTGGVPFSFTDATLAGSDAVVFLASAEDSPDAVQDGEVLGTSIGLIETDRARWTHLLDERGQKLKEKAEGVALDPGNPSCAWLCIDPDDPERPSDLCEVELSGSWW
jgi:hypothetical protein